MKKFFLRTIIIIFFLFLTQKFYVFHNCHGSEFNQGFTIQVMSSSGKDTANVFLEELKKKGYEAYIHEVTDKGDKKSYKVRIGKFKTREEAMEHAASLEKEKIDYWVTSLESMTVTDAEQKKVTEEQDSPSDITQNKDDKVSSVDTASIDKKSRPEESIKADEDWPGSISKIYKYYDTNGTLHVTNSYKRIPKEFLERIKEIVIFPVRFISFKDKEMVLRVEIEGEEKKVKLDDIKEASKPLPDKAVNDFADLLKKYPLRLKYDLGRVGADGTIHGSLYFRTGTSVGLEMVRRGIALCNLEELLIFKRKVFLEAEGHARREKKGVWAETNADF
jgi:hypothetical protein